MTPAAASGSEGSHSSAPTMTSDPRGSFTTAERNSSCRDRKQARRSAMLPAPRSGPPAITTRVGSPPVCESITWIRCAAAAFISADSRGCECRTILDRMADDGEDLLALGALDGQPRRPHDLRTKSGFGHRQLDVLYQFDLGVQEQQWRVPAVQFARLAPTSGGRQIPQRPVLVG